MMTELVRKLIGGLSNIYSNQRLHVSGHFDKQGMSQDGRRRICINLRYKMPTKTSRTLNMLSNETFDSIVEKYACCNGSCKCTIALAEQEQG